MVYSQSVWDATARGNDWPNTCEVARYLAQKIEDEAELELMAPV